VRPSGSAARNQAQPGGNSAPKESPETEAEQAGARMGNLAMGQEFPLADAVFFLFLNRNLGKTLQHRRHLGLECRIFLYPKINASRNLLPALSWLAPFTTDWETCR
jgi:hypothetical protein